MTETTEETVYRDGTTPVVAVDGSRLVARSSSARRELFPASWLRRKAAVLYDDGTPKGADVTGTLLEWCGVGLIVATGEAGGKTLVSWDSIRVVELVGE